MTEIMLHQSSSTNPLSSSPSSIPISDNDGLQLHQQPHESPSSLINIPNCYPVYRGLGTAEEEEEEEEEGCFRERKRREREGEGDQLSLLGVWFTVFRKSLIACRSSERVIDSMEIGVPTNVRHVAHVTFDRFNGFLGLPVEFEPDVPRRPPSASTRVFGVSTESMQLSFDSRGNSVPTILLMMQRRLYLQGGLQAEGIFRINGENSQEEYIREELNRGVVPENIDVHCLAGLIKAWFRELPNGILDSLAPEQVMQAQSEKECAQLVRLLPPTESALLDWAVNLMADVAQLENFNKMNARNIAMVFAPNMTQMADPLTALMYAVQVMNFLKTLIVKTLRDREESIEETGPTSSYSEPSDENGSNSSSQPRSKEVKEINDAEQAFVVKEPLLETSAHPFQGDTIARTETHGFLTSVESTIPSEKAHLPNISLTGSPDQVDTTADGCKEDDDTNRSTRQAKLNIFKARYGHQESASSVEKVSRNGSDCSIACVTGEKSRGTTIISRLNSRTERVEAWW